MSLYHHLLEAAHDVPDAIAIEDASRKLSFADLAEEARQVAAGLVAAGVRPGDSVGVMLPNVPEFVASLYGVLMAGCRFVPLNVMLRRGEIQYVAEDSRLRAILAADLFREEVQAAVQAATDPPQLVFVRLGASEDSCEYRGLLESGDASFTPLDVPDDAPIMTLYTSGTTGKPKGAVLNSANVISNARMVEKVAPSASDDATLCVLPLFHVFALNALLNTSIVARTRTVLQPRFEPGACLKSLADDGVTRFAGVPTMYFQLLKHPDLPNTRFPTLRFCICGGAPMPVEVLNEFEKIAGVPILEGYGLTETTVSVCFNRRDQRKVGSIGLPYDEVDIRIFDEQDKELPNGEVGELVVRGPNLMQGYLNRPDATAEAMRSGWFHTGDLAYRDEDGFFFIVDRKKDMIIKGGFNIYPREIEEVLYELPEVAEAAVIGVRDEAKGEVVRAVLAAKPGKTLSRERIESHLDERLSRYKLPGEYVFLDELPKGPTGKILKRALRDDAERWNKDRVPATRKEE